MDIVRTRERQRKTGKNSDRERKRRERNTWLKKKQSCALTARNKAELLVLEGGSAERSRWRK